MAASPVSVVFFDLGETLVHQARWLPGARRVLETLRLDGLRLGLISNTGSLTRAQLAAHLPPDFSFASFEAGLVVLSSEVGQEKPGLPIYLEALRRAGVAPPACCFVGERLDEHMAAQEVGMCSVRLSDSASDFRRLPGLLRAD